MRRSHLAARSSDAPAVGDTPPAAEGVAGDAFAPVGMVCRDLLHRSDGIHCACREHCDQEHQSALCKGAVAKEEARMEPIVEGVPVLIMWGNHTVPPPANVSRSIVVGPLVGTLVVIIGTNANDRGPAFSRHSCCGAQVTERAIVAFCYKQLFFHDGCKEDMLAMNLCMHGMLTCKVGT
jgi:hypothetical protein